MMLMAQLLDYDDDDYAASSSGGDIKGDVIAFNMEYSSNILISKYGSFQKPRKCLYYAYVWPW